MKLTTLATALLVAISGSAYAQATKDVLKADREAVKADRQQMKADEAQRKADR